MYIDGAYPQIKIKNNEFIDLIGYPELETKLKEALDNLKGGKALTKLEALNPQSYSLQLAYNDDNTYDVTVVANNHSIPSLNISYIPDKENPQVIIGKNTFSLENYPNLKAKFEEALTKLESKPDLQKRLKFFYEK